MTEVFGQQGPGTTANVFNTISFIVAQKIAQLAGKMPVEVVNVYNEGGVTAVGLVDVRPMVNQMTGNREAVPHGIIYGVPYFRLQGGANAIIIDPGVGDIGSLDCCYRDISNVKSAKAPANPASFRQFDWADGLYSGGYLNEVPSQYFQMLPAGAGINVVSPTVINLMAPNISLNASAAISIQSPANAIGGGGTSIDGKPFLPHGHTLVQAGGDNSGPVA
jgi:hypothetical protein